MDCEDQARDVVQFVFLRLCDQSPEEIGERLAQWLYTVCRNRALDVVRGARREKINVERVGLAVSAGAAFGGKSPPYDPATTVEQAELHALLRVLVECLPASQREAIDLWTDGFSYVEISRIIGKQEGHVRVLVHRGLKALREHPQVRKLIEDSEQEEQQDLPLDKASCRGGRRPQMEHR
jgi:RNA polymerase sigma-70 factor (ECF subfamily)